MSSNLKIIEGITKFIEKWESVNINQIKTFCVILESLKEKINNLEVNEKDKKVNEDTLIKSLNLIDFTFTSINAHRIFCQPQIDVENVNILNESIKSFISLFLDYLI